MSDINALKAKQDALAEDMQEVKGSLKDISTALLKLTALEEKHVNTQGALVAINKKLDKQEDRIRETELKMATQVWVERIVWVAVAGIISAVIVTLRG